MTEGGSAARLDPGGTTARVGELLARGRASEADALLREVPQHVRQQHPDLALAHAEVLHLCGATQEAIDAAREVEAAARARTDFRVAALATATRALALVRRGDARALAEARASLDPVLLVLATQRGSTASRVLHADGVLRLHEGDIDAARRSMLGALAGAQSTGESWRVAAILDSLGGVHLRLGDAARALRYLGMSLKLKRKAGDVLGQAVTRGNRGRLFLQEGAPDRALREFRADRALARRAGDRFGEVMALNGCGMALLEMRRLDEADATLREALAAAEARGYLRQAALCLKDLALVAERRGRIEEALGLVAKARGIFEHEGNLEGVGFCDIVRGRGLFRADRVAEARASLAGAVQTLRHTQRPDLLADALLRLVEASLPGNAGQLKAWLDEAESLAQRHLIRGVVHEVREIRQRLAATGTPDVVTIRNPLGFGPASHEYHLYEMVGEGLQGQAWKSLDTASAAIVLVKIVSIAPPRAAGAPAPGRAAPNAARNLRMALAEFEAAMRIDHPGVVRVFAFERRFDRLLMAMEYLPGGSLRARLRTGAPDAATGWRWITLIAEALEVLHASDVVHRDLNPNNVVFRTADDPVLVDFGLALLGKTLPSEEGGRLTIVGTPGYIAPELATTAGPAPDHRQDLFALGVLAVEVLTGLNPILEEIRGKTTFDYIALLRDPRTLRRLFEQTALPSGTSLPRRAAVLRLSDPDPRARFASAAEFLAAART